MPWDDIKGNVVVFAEYSGKEIDSLTIQLIMKARGLAQKLGVAVDALLIGKDLETQARILSKMGVARVFTVDHPHFQYYNPQLYSRTIAQLLKGLKPAIFLSGYTYMGMVIAPAVAARIGARLFTNCLDIELTDDRIRVTRPMFAGLVYTKVEAPKSTPVVISLQREPIPGNEIPEGTGEIVPFPVEISPDSLQVKVIQMLAEAEGEKDLKKAEVIVAAGRGIREKANLKLIEEFADALGGMVGCSRPVVDMGWLPLHHQIGISGKTIRPKIYIACGISGAVQHVTAISDSKMIVAINNDPKAPIFRVAKYGIVGNLFEVIPVLIQKAKEMNLRPLSKSGP